MTRTPTRACKKRTVSYFGGGESVTTPYEYRAIIGLCNDAGIVAALRKLGSEP